MTRVGITLELNTEAKWSFAKLSDLTSFPKTRLGTARPISSGKILSKFSQVIEAILYFIEKQKFTRLCLRIISGRDCEVLFFRHCRNRQSSRSIRLVQSNSICTFILFGTLVSKRLIWRVNEQNLWRVAILSKFWLTLAT